MEGIVSFLVPAPIANPDSANTIVGNPITVNVLANDTSADALYTRFTWP